MPREADQHPPHLPTIVHRASAAHQVQKLKTSPSLPPSALPFTPSRLAPGSHKIDVGGCRNAQLSLVRA